MNLRKTQKSLKEPFKARSALFRTRTAETLCTKKNAPKSFDFRASELELLSRFELETSSLPRMRSTN